MLSLRLTIVLECHSFSPFVLYLRPGQESNNGFYIVYIFAYICLISATVDKGRFIENENSSSYMRSSPVSAKATKPHCT